MRTKIKIKPIEMWAVCNVAYREVTTTPSPTRAGAVKNFQKEICVDWPLKKIQDAGYIVRKFHLVQAA